MILNELIHILCYAPLSFITYLVLGRILDVPRRTAFALLLTMLHVGLHIMYTFAVMQSISWADLVRTLVQMSVVFVVPLFFSRRKRVHTILACTLTMLASTAAELAALFTYSSLGGSFDAHIMTDPFSNVPAYVLMYVMNLAFLLFFLWVIWNLWNRFVLRSSPRAAWYFMFFPLSQVIWLAVAEIYAITSKMPVSRYLYFLPAILLSILADWLLFRSIGKLTKQVSDEAEARWYRDLLSQQENYYSYILADQENTARIRHDMRNQIQTAYALIHTGETESAQRQLTELTKLMDQSPSYCRNPMTNAIINVKQLQCREYGIDLRIHCDVPENLDVHSIDLCSLFSNLLDNAIDAVRILPEKQRTISLFSAMEGDLFSVRCENPYSEKPETATTSSVKGHGLGLIILQNLAEKYHGHFEIQAEDGNFIATVWLFAVLKKN